MKTDLTEEQQRALLKTISTVSKEIAKNTTTRPQFLQMGPESVDELGHKLMTGGYLIGYPENPRWTNKASSIDPYDRAMVMEWLETRQPKDNAEEKVKKLREVLLQWAEALSPKVDDDPLLRGAYGMVERVIYEIDKLLEES